MEGVAAADVAAADVAAAAADVGRNLNKSANSNSFLVSILSQFF